MKDTKILLDYLHTSGRAMMLVILPNINGYTNGMVRQSSVRSVVR